LKNSFRGGELYLNIFLFGVTGADRIVRGDVFDPASGSNGVELFERVVFVDVVAILLLLDPASLLNGTAEGTSFPNNSAFSNDENVLLASSTLLDSISETPYTTQSVWAGFVWSLAKLNAACRLTPFRFGINLSP
jgi:hypothetical protein